MNIGQTPEEIASRVEDRLITLTALQADFEQIYYSSMVSTPLREYGKFYLQRPGQMKWVYTDPEKKIYLYKDAVFEEFLPEENLLTRTMVSDEGNESEIISLLSGKRGLLENYSIKLSSFPTDSPESRQLKLTPIKEDLYEFLLLEIENETWLIRRLIFFDWAGNKQEFLFKNIQINPRFPPDTFDIKLPEGIEVIEEIK